MNRKALWAAAAAALAVISIATLLLWPRGAADEPTHDTAEETAAADGDEALAAEDTVVASLYFPGGGGGLHAEQREVPAGGLAEERIAALVGALLAGPRDDALRSPLPDTVSVRRVYLMDGGVVYLDLESPEGEPPPSGSQREMLTVYSLVNTVLLNTEDVDRLVLLWNGRQPLTFAGHLDTGRPLTANRSLIASRR